MNEAWQKQIQPILDSSQNDHFSLIFEPFIKYYPTLNENQRLQVEDALSITAFDTDDENLAIRALSIAETLYTSHLASQKLSGLMKSGLREKVRNLKIDSAITYYYIVASSFFGVTEAIPFIKSISEQIEKAYAHSDIDKISGNTHSYEQWLQACSAALLRLEPYYPKSGKAKY